MVYLSFTEYKFPGTPHFNGLANFIKASKDTLYWQSVWNTLVFTFCDYIHCSFCTYNRCIYEQKIQGKRVFRVIYYLPAVVSEVVNAILFLWLFNAQFGVINTTLMKIGIKSDSMAPDFSICNDRNHSGGCMAWRMLECTYFLVCTRRNLQIYL